MTIGQYLRPTPKHAPVERYVTPEQFAVFEREGQAMGFQFVASGPLVRSSYHAAEAFVAAARAPTRHAEAGGVVPQVQHRPDVQPSASGTAVQLIPPTALVRR